MSFRLILLTLLFLAFKISARAQVPDFDRYPTREIDRPYLIPGDLREIRLGGSFLLKRPTRGASGQLGFQPLIQYESGHSETFAWLFSPLPFGFKAQPIFNDRHRLGFLMYYEYFATGVAVNYRFRTGGMTAIEVEAAADEIDVFFVKTRRAEIAFRPIFQLTDRLALIGSGAYGRYGFGSDYLDAFLDGFPRDSADRGWASANAWSAGIEAQWTVNTRFDLRGGVTRWHYLANGLTSDALTGQAQGRFRF